MKTKGKLVTAAVFAALFGALIALVRLVDVAAIGPEGTKIGLSHINKAVFETTGVNLFWYRLTEVFGIAALCCAVFFAVLGFVQLIKRRSILKVDRELLALGVLYAVVLALYALFEVVIVNYRPVIMQGAEHTEASFPSSHTMLICVVVGSAFMIAGKYIKNRTVLSVIRTLCVLVVSATVAGRLVCGVHWLTDIVGGVLLSIALLALYSCFIGRRSDEEEDGAKE